MKKGELKELVKECLEEARGITIQDMDDSDADARKYLTYAFKELSAVSKKLAKEYRKFEEKHPAGVAEQQMRDVDKKYPNAFFNLLTGRFM